MIRKSWSKFLNDIFDRNFPCNYFGRIIFFSLVFLNLIFASWYVLHGDIYYHADIARDLLILNEIEQDKIVLIGARTDASGIFHGPLWLYVNFPAYLLGRGNPVIIGWYWIFLTAIFLFSSFYIAKKIFNEKTALYFTLLMSTFFIFEANSFTNPIGALFLSLIFFYTFQKYINTLNIYFLIANIFIIGFIVHFQMVIGLPLLLLTFIYTTYLHIRKKKVIYSSAFLLVMIPLSTYILFDLRHEFIQLNNFAKYLEESRFHGEGLINIVKNRLEYMITMAIPLVKNGEVNKITAIFFYIILIKVFLTKKSTRVYCIFLYFFLGFFILSMKSPYYLMPHHFNALVPVVLLIFSSILTSKPGRILLPIFFLIIIFNEIAALSYINNSKSFIGKNTTSWKTIYRIVDDIFQVDENEFGYFINSPDKLGYGTKYAMIYGKKKFKNKTAYYFEKKPVTYVITSPPPEHDPYVNMEWYIKNEITLTSEPKEIIDYPGGYKVYRFELSSDEISIPYNKLLDTGIHFR